MRTGLAVGLAVAALVWSVAVLPGSVARSGSATERHRDRHRRPAGRTRSRTPYAVMPFLQRRALDPDDHWVVFENGVREHAALLSVAGHDAHGAATPTTPAFWTTTTAIVFDETSTLATWMRDAGLPHRARRQVPEPVSVRTRPRTCPQGWDRWWGRKSTARRRPCTTTTRCSNRTTSSTYGSAPTPTTRPTSSRPRPSSSSASRRSTGRSSCGSAPTAPHPPGPPPSDTRARSTTSSFRCRRRWASPTSRTSPPGCGRSRASTRGTSRPSAAPIVVRTETLLAVDDARARDHRRGSARGVSSTRPSSCSPRTTVSRSASTAGPRRAVRTRPASACRS